jgi:hypothetical protein
MARDLTQLANHLDGLIVLADLAWRERPEKHADMARTFWKLGKAHERAAERAVPAERSG